MAFTGEPWVNAGDQRARLREALIDYARAHPNASDTMAGIRGFWLASLRDTSPSDLEVVVEALVDDGVLGITRLPDGTTLYSVTERGSRP